MRRSALLFAALAVAGAHRVACAGDGPASAPERAGVSLTVYSSADPAGFDPQQFIEQARQGYGQNWAAQVPGFGVVKEERALDLAEGLQDLRVVDVAQFIDPTTVSFTDLGSLGQTTVLEQAFRFDLASPEKIFERYLDKNIGVDALKDGQVVGHVDGRVLSVNQGMVVLQTSDGLRFVGARDPGIRLPSLPDGLLTKPTLIWKIAAEKAGPRRVRTTYQTAGLTWRADYSLVLSQNDTKADVSAWVSLLNLSGASYPNAGLKLVAGDVQRIQAPRSGYYGGQMAARKSLGMEAGFQEKGFFEYHLYTLPRKTDVLSQSTQQLVLFPTARGASVEKVLVYYGLPDAASWSFTPQPRTDRDVRPQSNPKVDVYVRFKNAKENALGMPLPKGKVRVYEQDDADGTLEFVGEDLIDHTPKDETVMVRVGQAFDVVGERTQTRFDVNERARVMTESYRITLRNHKPDAVKVLVKENLFRWVGWDIVQSTDPFTKTDSRTITFEVTVPPDGSKDVVYTVRYRW